MKYLLLYISFIILTCVVSCRRDMRMSERLQSIDSIMENKSDSAYNVLIGLSDSTLQMSTDERMLYYTLLADASNKTYHQLPSDTILKEVVDYYERHGSINQRMRSLYMLGSYYRDADRPLDALHCYKKAVGTDKSEDSECDYSLKARIYGQMAELFYYQYLPEKAIEANNNFIYYSLKSENTYQYIRGIELQMEYYNLLQDTMKVFELTDSVHKLYIENGMPDKAARVYPSAISLSIDQGKYSEAKTMMDEFESKSGLFTSNGDIDSLYGRYYYSKGLYSLHFKDYTSAESYFRKLLDLGYYNEGYNGMTSLYNEKHNSDSVLKYSEKRDESLSLTLSKMHTSALNNSSIMYEYNDLQENISNRELEVVRMKQVLWIILSIFLLILILSYYLLNKYKRKKRNEFLSISRSYNQNLALLTKSEDELLHLKDSFSKLAESSHNNAIMQKGLANILEEKQKEIDNLKSQLELSTIKQSVNDNRLGIQLLSNTETVNKLRAYLQPGNASFVLAESVWQELENQTLMCLPSYYTFITENNNLNLDEKKVSILLLLDFSSKELSILCNTTITNISNIKKRINQKLYGVSSAKKLIYNLKNTALKHDRL